MKRIVTEIQTTDLCSYGCGHTAKYINKSGNLMCDTNSSKCPAIKLKNSNAVKAAYESGSDNLTNRYNNIPQDTKKRMAWSRDKDLVSNDSLFIVNSPISNGAIKKRILKHNLIEYKCDRCSIDSWQGEKLSLELDHINGINNDHRIENLRFLCPNCHSLTDTFCGRNVNSGLTKVSDDELLSAYKETGNIRQSLIMVGLAPKGGNYGRIYKLISNLEK